MSGFALTFAALVTVQGVAAEDPAISLLESLPARELAANPPVGPGIFSYPGPIDPVPDLHHERRSDCDEVRGTQYVSKTEREWFLNSCVVTVLPDNYVGPHIVVSGGLSYEEVYALASAYPWDAQEATCIALEESGWRPGIVSPTGDHGLFQINALTWEYHFGERWAYVYDPATNVRMAFEIYQRAGYTWAPWMANNDRSCA